MLFSRNKAKADGYQSWCKLCRKEHDAVFYQENKIHLLSTHANYKLNSASVVKSAQHLYYQTNKENILNKQRQRYTENKAAFRVVQNRSEQKRLLANPEFRLKKRLRIRLHSALKNSQKSGSAVKDLGCTIPELKMLLEQKWQQGMTWDNWTRDGWHIDHIKPLASFNLEDREQFLEAVHYTNLQPLWATDNISKSDHI